MKSTRPLSSADSWLAGEIIPDSEEERKKSNPEDVIEISSEEEDAFNARTSLEWPANTDAMDVRPFRSTAAAYKTGKFTPRLTHRARRIVLSSDSEESGDCGKKRIVTREIIELSDSSPERPDPRKAKPFLNPSPPSDKQDIWDDNSAILVLDEPKGVRKPVRQVPSTPQTSSKVPAHAKPLEDLRFQLEAAPNSPHRRQDTPETPSTPTSGTKGSRSKKEGPRGKKALAAARKKKLQLYAEELFEELNRVVFKNGLPMDTKLNWNVRLLSTAGRARWHRSRDGVQTTEIELAEKILDCEERIRNTLSHEMCHLATWVIDNDPKEAHGAQWKAWAAKVMRKRPEIEITTRHDYEISYPFQWECEKCGKIYGRFSKSIRPDEVVCGACKEGRLIPLFSEKEPKTPKTTKMSYMASAKPQDSPHSRPAPHNDSQGSEARVASRPLIHDVHDSESEYDIDLLTTDMEYIVLGTY